MGDSLIGIVGDGFVLLACTAEVARGPLVLKNLQDKMFELDEHKVMASAGEAGDRVAFCEFIQKNIQWQYFRTGVHQRTKAVATYTRGTLTFTPGQLAKALREGPYNANILLGGFDANGAQLFTMDYFGAMHQVQYACQGYAGAMTSGILDKGYKANMTPQEALQLVKKCIEEMRTRFLLRHPVWILRSIDKDGIHNVDMPQ